MTSYAVHAMATASPTTSAPTAAPHALSPGFFDSMRLVASDIKLAHSIFALPFAVLAAFLARPEGSPWPRFFGQLALVILCMVLARTWAMLVNRLADREIDRANPRTSRRVFASGRLTAARGWTIAMVFAGLFITAAGMFWVFFGNPWPVVLSAPVLAWIAFYSLTKRFTWLCHLVLGTALAASPIAAAIAVDPSSVGLTGAGVRTPAIYWLGAMVVCWVAGFDIIYALQDLGFDRASKLWSIPARLGVSRAIWCSRGLHAGAIIFLLLSARAEHRFHSLYLVGILAVVGLLVAEHVVLTRRGERGLDLAFFTLNGVLSCVLGCVGVLDLLT